MALTKISGGILDPGISVAGIVTATGFDGPFIGGSDGINAGVGTFTGLDVNGNGDISGNLVVGGNLTANGDFTTLNTTLREVELLRVDANSSAIAGIITQRGSGDIFSAYDASTQVFKIADGGDVTFFGATTDRNIIFDRSENTLQVKRNAILKIGQGSYSTDLYSDGTNTIFDHNTIGALFVKSNIFQVYGTGTSGGNTYDGTIFRCMNGRTELGYEVPNGGATTLDNLVTTPLGVTVGTGVTIERSGQASFAGIVTFTGNIDANGNLDVDGQTDLDVLNVSDTATFTGTNGISIDTAGYAYLNFQTDRTNASDNIGGPIFKNASGGVVSKIQSFVDGQINIRTGTGNPPDYAFVAKPNGAVELYHNGTKKLETDQAGVIVTGIATATSFTAIEGGITGQYLKNQIKWDRNNYNYIDCTNDSGQFAIRMGSSQTAAFSIDTSADTIFSNNRKIKMGSGNKLELYSDGSNSLITDSSSALFVRSNRVLFQNSAGNKGYGEFTNSGSVYFTYDNVKRIETSGIGVTVTGEVAASQDYPNFRPTLDFNFASEKKLDPRITYQRTGPASFINEFGKVVIVGDNAPKFDHDPVTRESKGLLIEESRTNIIYPSSDWSFTNWTHENSNTSQEKNTTDTEDPAGTFSATKITPTTASSLRSIYWGTNITFTNGVNFTMSAFAKSTTGLHVQLRPRGQGSNKAWATFNLTTGVVGNSGGSVLVSTRIEKYPNDWYRCFLTFTGGGQTGGGFGALIMDDGNDGEAGTHTGDPSKSIFFWGAQFETGSFATSYIPTDSAAVTRGRDIVDIDGEDFTDFYNQTESTIISSHTLLPNVPNAENVYVYQIQDASTNNAIRVIDKNGSYSNVATAIVINSGSSQGHFNNTTDSFTKDKVLVALSVKNNDFAASHNGSTAESNTNGTLPTNMNSLGIGRYPPSGGYELNGHFQRFIYYPKQLSDSQLKTLTS